MIFGRDIPGGATAFADVQLTTTALSPNIGFRILGAAANDESGYSVSNAGDVNGDDIDDVIIGAHTVDPPSGSNAGVSYVIFGRSPASQVANPFGDIQLTTTALPVSIGFRIIGAAANDESGYFVSNAGDVNGDGIGDIMVGAPDGDPLSGSNAGISYVIFGRDVAGGATAFGDIQLTNGATALSNSVGFRMLGAASIDNNGHAMSAAGDINRDGIGDVIVGVQQADPSSGSGAGISYVIYGRDGAGGGSTFGDIQLTNGATALSASVGFRILGAAASDQSGYSVSAAGDVNNDGIGDIIVAARSADPPGRSDAGITYVIFGTEPPPTSQPSSQPSRQPSGQPSRQPSPQPSSQPVGFPTSQPSRKPSTQPSAQPSSQPIARPSSQPSIQPSLQPTRRPSEQPSSQPSSQPSAHPSSQPVNTPSAQPSIQPSNGPSSQPSQQPLNQPSGQPSLQPSSRPSSQPLSQPSSQPSASPSSQSSTQPSSSPSMQPSLQPSVQPSVQPTSSPSVQPSAKPSSAPSTQPSSRPSRPSVKPSLLPTSLPSTQPTVGPSTQPSTQPSNRPSAQPSLQPLNRPSAQPSSQPSSRPSAQPFSQPSSRPSAQPFSQPSSRPSAQPFSQPSNQPSAKPSFTPSSIPSVLPSLAATAPPTGQPSLTPSGIPTLWPGHLPSVRPSSQPSQSPTTAPSSQPTRNPTVSTVDPASPGEWAYILVGSAEISSGPTTINGSIWTCGRSHPTTAETFCAVTNAVLGKQLVRHPFPWVDITSISQGSELLRVHMSGATVQAGSSFAEVATCDIVDAQLSCTAKSFVDTFLAAGSYAAVVKKMVYVGEYNAQALVIVVDNTITLATRSFLYSSTIMNTVIFTHIQSPPNYIGSFVAGMCVNSGLLTNIFAAMMRTDTGTMTAMYVAPVSGSVLNRVELVNAMALEYERLDSFIAGGLQLTDDANMHAYLLCVNSIYRKVIFSVRYIVAQEMVGAIDRRALLEKSPTRRASAVKGMAVLDKCLYLLVNYHAPQSGKGMAVLQADVETGSILHQVQILSPYAELDCTTIAISGLFLAVACSATYMNNVTETIVLSVDRALTFSRLPEGFQRYENSTFVREPIALKATLLPLSAKIFDRNPVEYTFKTTNLSPTNQPTVVSSPLPSLQPSDVPSSQPSSSPTVAPSVSPQPTSHPSSSGPTNTYKPTAKPTERPSVRPSCVPTVLPSVKPSTTPTARPSTAPSVGPTT